MEAAPRRPDAEAPVKSMRKTQPQRSDSWRDSGPPGGNAQEDQQGCAVVAAEYSGYRRGCQSLPPSHAAADSRQTR
jgi:hypothetical protein